MEQRGVERMNSGFDTRAESGAVQRRESDGAASVGTSGARLVGGLPYVQCRTSGAASGSPGALPYVQMKVNPSDPYSKAGMLELLQEDASKQGLDGLYKFFEGLSDASQAAVLKAMLGGKSPETLTLKQLRSGLTGWLGRKVRWDDMAPLMRAAKAQEQPPQQAQEQQQGGGGGLTRPGDPTSSSTGAKAHVGTKLANAGLALSSGIAGVSGDTSAAVGGLTGVGGGLTVPGVGIATSALDTARAASRLGDAQTRTDDQNLVETGNLQMGLTDTARQSALTAKGAIELGSAGNLAAATAATAGLSIAAGGYSLMNGAIQAGVYGVRAGSLDAIAQKTRKTEKTEDGSEEGEHAGRLAGAAELGARSARLNRNVSAATAAKGAAMIVGGALIFASNPIGWMVLTGAAILGGITAFLKWRRKKARSEDIADRELRIQGSTSAERERNRSNKLHSLGFYDAADFYQAYVATTASYLHQKMLGEDADTVQLLDAMGLKPDFKNKKYPSVEDIAKQIHD